MNDGSLRWRIQYYPVVQLSNVHYKKRCSYKLLQPSTIIFNWCMCGSSLCMTNIKDYLSLSSKFTIPKSFLMPFFWNIFFGRCPLIHLNVHVSTNSFFLQYMFSWKLVSLYCYWQSHNELFWFMYLILCFGIKALALLSSFDCTHWTHIDGVVSYIIWARKDQYTGLNFLIHFKGEQYSTFQYSLISNFISVFIWDCLKQKTSTYRCYVFVCSTNSIHFLVCSFNEILSEGVDNVHVVQQC